MWFSTYHNKHMTKQTKIHCTGVGCNCLFTPANKRSTTCPDCTPKRKLDKEALDIIGELVNSTDFQNNDKRFSLVW